MKKSIHTLLAVLLVLAMSVSLFGCSANDVATEAPEKEAPAATEEKTAPVEDTKAEPEADDTADGEVDKSQFKIGICQIQYTTPWRITETNSILRALYEDGYTNIIYTNAGGDVQKQVANGEDLLAQGVDLLLLSPMDLNGLTPVLEAAKAAGVPVILNDRKATGVAGEDYITFVGQDQVMEGRLIGEWILEEFGGNANIVSIQGNPVSSSVIDRDAGFKQVVEENPGLKIIAEQVGNDTLTEAHTVMTNILQAHGGDEIDVVFAFCSQMAIGAGQAMREFGLEPGKDIKICCIDGMPTDLEAIINGDFDCVIQCNPFLGDKTVEVVNRVLLDGETTDTIGTEYLVEDAVYTKDNAEDCLADMNATIEYDQSVADTILK